jgi:hypothetical protein
MLITIQILNTLLLLVIAAGTAYTAYHYYSTSQERAGTELKERRMRIYREIVRLFSVITRDGDVSRDELLRFRSNTMESSFLFDKEISDYINTVHARASKLRATTELLKSRELPIGEERDKITVENSKQMIWLADQLPLLNKKFVQYLNNDDMINEAR